MRSKPSSHYEASQKCPDFIRNPFRKFDVYKNREAENLPANVSGGEQNVAILSPRILRYQCLLCWRSDTTEETVRGENQNGGFRLTRGVALRRRLITAGDAKVLQFQLFCFVLLTVLLGRKVGSANTECAQRI